MASNRILVILNQQHASLRLNSSKVLIRMGLVNATDGNRTGVFMIQDLPSNIVLS